MKGFHVEGGPTLLLIRLVRGAGDRPVPPLRLRVQRRPPGTSFTYRCAADMYYGVIAGLAVFTK